MSRPVAVTRLRGRIYLTLIDLAGQGLLWPLVALVGFVLLIVITVVTWPLVPVLLGIGLVITVVLLVIS